MDKENIKRGAFLKELRTANLLSEKELANLLDVEPSDITVWETGIKFPEDNDTLVALAKILHVTKKELLNGEFKKDRNSDETIKIEYVEKDSSDDIISNNGKNIILIVLSCFVLFILVVTVASVAGTKKVYTPSNTIEVSDEREAIHHEPHKSNEYIIYNTQVLSANDPSNIDGSSLLNYGFVKVDNKYIKNTNKYRIEFYNSVFHLTVYRKSGNLYVTRTIGENLIRYTDSNKSKTVTIDMAAPSGKVNCDEYSCVYNSDYYRYLNLLVSAIRG